MTDRAALLVRIAGEIALRRIAEATSAEIAAAVLAELETTHDVVPKGTWMQIAPECVGGFSVSWDPERAPADPAGEGGAVRRNVAKCRTAEG